MAPKKQSPSKLARASSSAAQKFRSRTAQLQAVNSFRSGTGAIGGSQAGSTKSTRKLQFTNKGKFRGTVGFSSTAVPQWAVSEGHPYQPDVWQERLEESDTAKDVETKSLQEWADSESMDPTDPYLVLRVERGESLDNITKMFERRLKEVGARGAVANVLRQRLQRSFEILSSPDKLEEFEQVRKDLVHLKKWGRIKYANGYYEGGISWSPGHISREGRGVVVLSSGEKYEGYFKGDSKHGCGLQLWANGDVHVGQWVNGLLQGSGVYYYNTGSVFAGEFYGGGREGAGRLTWPSGSCYWGEWESDARTGNGVLRLGPREKPSAHYVGQWKCGKKHREGVFGSLTDGWHHGEFEDDKPHGWGKSVTGVEEQEQVFEGFFKNGTPHGLGTLTWTASKDVYSGEFFAGMFDGEGSMDYQAISKETGVPTRYQGEWRKGKPNGKGEYKGTVSYTGQWLEGQKHGDGKCSWGAGEEFIGNFVRDKRHGAGKIKAPGTSWDGFFENDVRHGKALMLNFATSEAIEEVWHHGVLVERNGKSTLCQVGNDVNLSDSEDGSDERG